MDVDHEELEREVLVKIGGNILLFQQIEGLLKFLMVNTLISGGMIISGV
jgi:hypothetical protein